MSLLSSLVTHLHQILTNTISNQSQTLAPLLVLLLVPLLFLLLSTTPTRFVGHLYHRWATSTTTSAATMVLESLGLGLPWNWSFGAHNPTGAASGGSDRHERKRAKKKHVRTRSEQQQQGVLDAAGAVVGNGHAKPDGRPYLYDDGVECSLTHAGAAGDSNSSGSDVDDGYYPGLVNISGTYCFMNSTIQVR